MELELHIDIYSIILFYVSLFLYIYQLSKLLIRIKDEKLRKELDKMLDSYSLALGSGDWIVWPVILTVIYPFYALMKLCLKGKLCLLFKTLIADRQLEKITMTVSFLWITSTLFALLHWFFAFAVTFIVGLATYISLHKKEKEFLKGVRIS